MAAQEGADENVNLGNGEVRDGVVERIYKVFTNEEMAQEV